MRVTPRQLMNLAKRTERLSSQAFRSRQMDLVKHLDGLAIEIAVLSAKQGDKSGLLFFPKLSKGDKSGRRKH